MILDVGRLRCHSIPEAHVNLEVQLGVAEVSGEFDPLAGIVLCLSDL
jgi:hypothetical protein